MQAITDQLAVTAIPTPIGYPIENTITLKTGPVSKNQTMCMTDHTIIMAPTPSNNYDWKNQSQHRHRHFSQRPSKDDETPKHKNSE